MDWKSETAKMAAGDQDALERLRRHYWPKMRPMAASILKDDEAVDDVMQNSFLCVWRHRDKLACDLRSFEAWLARTVYTKAIQQRRSQQRVRLQPRESSCQQPISLDEDSELVRAIRELPGELREALLLVDVLELPISDAAVLLDCAAGTVKSRRHSARAQLRETASP